MAYDSYRVEGVHASRYGYKDYIGGFIHILTYQTITDGITGDSLMECYFLFGESDEVLSGVFHTDDLLLN